MGRAPQPITALEDGLIVHPEGAWAYWRIPTVSYEWRSQGEAERLAGQAAHALAGLRSAVGHLHVVPRPYQPQAWAEQLTAATPTPAPGFHRYLKQVVDHLEGAGYPRREVYLGVRLTGRQDGLWQQARQRALGVLGLRDPKPARRAVRERLLRRRESLHRVLAGSGLSARLATAGELRWLVQRAAWRGLGEPPVPAGDGQPWAGGGLRALYEVAIEEHYRHLIIDQPAGRAAHGWLAPARWPDTLTVPGGEWLYQSELVGWPVEISVRFQIIPAHQAVRAVGRRAAQATDQARHAREAGRSVPLDVAEARTSARRLHHHLAHSGTPLVYCWPRWAVAAPTAEELDEVVDELVEHYRQIGIELVRPTGSQLDLYDEALPAGRVRLSSYRQELPPLTLAGGLPHASAEVGDQTGPYLGQTTGRSACPVHFDPLTAARRNLPTAIAITGVQGGGKTSAARQILYHAALQGAAVLSIDPKGEPGGLADLDGIGDVQVLDLDHAPPGLLDPYTVAEDDQRAALAVETLSQLIAQPLTGSEEAALIQACQAEAEQTDRPCLAQVLHRLRDHGGDAGGLRLASRLSQYSALPLAKLCFAPGTKASLRLEGVTEIRFGGLSFPEGAGAGAERALLPLRQRLALAMLHLLTELTDRLLDLDRNQLKVVAIDEAWALTLTGRGRHLMEKLSRLGRARNTAVVFISQNAGDLADDTVRNALSAVLAFRAGSSDEAQDALRLVGVENTRRHRQAITDLATGECLLRDFDHRVGTVYLHRITDQLRQALNTTPGRTPAGIR